MTTSTSPFSRRSLWRIPAAVTAVALLIPFLGNHFVEGWNWQPRAFVLFGTVIFGTSLMYQLTVRSRYTVAYRAAVGLALGSTFLLVWVNFVQAADGINPSATLYFLVPLVESLGVCVARLRPDRLARALFATAFAQGMILSVVLFLLFPRETTTIAGVWRGMGLNAFFALLFAGSASLFLRDSRVGASVLE